MDTSNPEALKHVDAVWGFGRRVCPGKAFAESNLWLVIANTIAVMDVRKALDEGGNPITPTAEFNYGTIRYYNKKVQQTIGLIFTLWFLLLDTPNRSSAQSHTVPRRRDSLSQMR